MKRKNVSELGTDIVGYLITEVSEQPAADNPNWTTEPPATYFTAGAGNVTLFGWVKDYTG